MRVLGRDLVTVATMRDLCRLRPERVAPALARERRLLSSTPVPSRERQRAVQSARRLRSCAVQVPGRSRRHDAQQMKRQLSEEPGYSRGS